MMVKKVITNLDWSTASVDKLEKYDLFSDSHYGFGSPRSTANLLTVASDRIARTYF